MLKTLVYVVKSCSCRAEMDNPGVMWTWLPATLHQNLTMKVNWLGTIAYPIQRCLQARPKQLPKIAIYLRSWLPSLWQWLSLWWCVHLYGGNACVMHGIHCSGKQDIFVMTPVFPEAAVDMMRHQKGRWLGRHHQWQNVGCILSWQTQMRRLCHMQGRLLYVLYYLPEAFLNSFMLPIDNSFWQKIWPWQKYEAKPWLMYDMCEYIISQSWYIIISLTWLLAHLQPVLRQTLDCSKKHGTLWQAGGYTSSASSMLASSSQGTTQSSGIKASAFRSRNRLGEFSNSEISDPAPLSAMSSRPPTFSNRF